MNKGEEIVLKQTIEKPTCLAVYDKDRKSLDFLVIAPKIRLEVYKDGSCKIFCEGPALYFEAKAGDKEVIVKDLESAVVGRKSFRGGKNESQGRRN